MKLSIIYRVRHGLEIFRVWVRSEALWLIVLAALIGAIAALVVQLMNFCSLSLHKILFNLDTEGRLSSLNWIDPWHCILIPALGGIILAFSRVLQKRYAWFSNKPVDAVEANALHGGKMSIKDSLYVVWQTLCSNGFGISLGLEAAYTQLSAAFGSYIGTGLRVRRSDMRILVGCGAAGAISAAFNSPLGGAFYAFETIIASYNLINLPPVLVASISAVTVIRLMGDTPPVILVAPTSTHLPDYGYVIAFALICSLIGIGVMILSTQTEKFFAYIKVPKFFRPAIGGLIVGSMAIDTPSIMGSGHGTLWMGLAGNISFELACFILVFKALASSISLGAGFRGGLFFASMLLGAVAGIVFGNLLIFMGIHSLTPLLYALIGTAVMAVTIIGGPLTMLFIALDMTDGYGSLNLVLLAVIASAVTVKKIFGYSFATWRFHLSGENIQSALDISWIRNLTVGCMMNEPLKTMHIKTTLQQARADFPIGQVYHVVLNDNDNQYCGMVSAENLFKQHSDLNAPLQSITQYQDCALLPSMNVKEALDQMEKANANELAVIHDWDKRYIIGILSKDYALMRYNVCLERDRQELAGERSRLRLGRKQ